MTKLLMEKAANNITTILVARFAMIVTPALLWFIWDSQVKRLEKVEEIVSIHTLELKNHEVRISGNKIERDDLRAETKVHFAAIDATMRTLNEQLALMNSTLVRIDTTIKLRIPEPRNSTP